MQLRFEVGATETHVVDFRFDQFWGTFSIRVDGRVVRRDFRLASVSLVKVYELVIGDTERHTVQIRKTRKQLLAGFRPQLVEGFVDGQLVATSAA